MPLEDKSAETEIETEVEQTSEDVVVEASPPDATKEGADPSTAAAEEVELSDDEKFRKEFIDKYDGGGEPEAEETATDKPEVKAEDGTDKAEHLTDAEDDEARITDEEFKGLSENVRQRIGALNKKTRIAEKANVELTSERDQFKQSHDQLEVVQKFSQENGLTSDGINQAMNVAAMFGQGRHAEFLAAVEPMISQAKQAMGQEYAPDLQQQIDDGHMTEEAAMQLTQANAATARATAEADSLRNANTQQTQVTSQNDHVTSMQTAMNEAEAQLKLSDPDYALKSAAIQAELSKQIAAGQIPRSAAEAANMVRSAHALTPKPARPAPKPTKPTPTASTKKGGKPVYKNSEENFMGRMNEYQPPH